MIKVSKAWKKKETFGVSMSEHEAFSYFLDCQLATVEEMAMKKSTPKSGFNRQIAIAQKMYDFVDHKGIEVSSGSRAIDVSNGFRGSVFHYAIAISNGELKWDNGKSRMVVVQR